MSFGCYMWGGLQSTILEHNIQRLKHAYLSRNATARDNEMVFRDNLTLKVHPDSRSDFEYFCYNSPESVEEMDNFLSLSQGKKRLLDIGAMDGIFSLVFAKTAKFSRVIAVDPSPLAYSHLLYNIHKNKLTNITPVECALSDTNGAIRMHYEWKHVVAVGTTLDGLCVEKQTGDDLCENMSFLPDIIKIDVEGHEVKVLRGLSHVLEQEHPMLFLEIHPARIDQEKDSINELFEILERNGYLGAGDIPLEDIANLIRRNSYRNKDTRAVFVSE